MKALMAVRLMYWEWWRLVKFLTKVLRAVVVKPT